MFVREDLLDPRIIHRCQDARATCFATAIDLHFDERVVDRRESQRDVRKFAIVDIPIQKEQKFRKRRENWQELQGVETSQDMDRMEKSKQTKDEQTVLNRIQVK
jgi:hypothetical protein